MNLQYVSRQSGVESHRTAVKAETNPHVTVTRARYSRGAGTVFMIRFEGTCIWAQISTSGQVRIYKEAHKNIPGEQDRQ